MTIGNLLGLGSVLRSGTSRVRSPEPSYETLSALWSSRPRQCRFLHEMRGPDGSIEPTGGLGPGGLRG